MTRLETAVKVVVVLVDCDTILIYPRLSGSAGCVLCLSVHFGVLLARALVRGARAPVEDRHLGCCEVLRIVEGDL
jgi:hypothetical protein